jgi:creatinine amidohydrolase
MRWEFMTASDIKEARKHQVAIFCLGSLEKHGDHLPVGIDTLVTHKLACLAAEREPAVVLPPLYYALTISSKTRPGAISISVQNLLPFLENICDEIHRNGFRKILFFNLHGGNGAFVDVLGQYLLDKQKPYLLFFPQVRPDASLRKEVLETEMHGHACECETSCSLHLFPELVKMERIRREPVGPRRDYDLPGATTALWWNSAWPEHAVGEPYKATADKGRRLVEPWVEALANVIRRVKETDKVFDHLEEYVRDVNQGLPGPSPET